jgi:hypothetical protein
VARLGEKIVIADLRPQPDFFVLAVVNVAFVLPLLLLVLEFAEVHDSANRRLLGGRHFDKIEPERAGLLERLVPGDDS